MIKKILTISIIALLALAIVAGGFWFAQNGGDNVEVVQEVKKEEKVKITETTETSTNIKPPTTPTNPDVTPQKEEIAQGEKKETIKQIAQNEKDEIDTSDWKEYCNQEHGFCLKYPENFNLINWNNKHKAFSFDEYTIAIEVRDKAWDSFDEIYEKNKKWQDVVKTTPFDEIGPGHVIRKLPVKEDVIILGGIKAEKIINKSPVYVEETDWIVVQFESKGVFYKVSLLGGNDGVSSDIENIFDNMIESFQLP